MMNLKQCRQGFYLLLLSTTLSSCASISRFIPNFTKTETTVPVEFQATRQAKSGLHCYLNSQTQAWNCQDQDYPSEILSLSDVGLQEKSKAIPARPYKETLNPSFVSPLRSNHEPKINDKSREILNKPSTFFAVQLLALSSETALHKYAKSKQLADPMYTQIDANGQHLYVLLLGIYSDRSSASKASQRWSKQGNRNAKPWIRTLGSLQNKIVLTSRS